jgi:hypothetical protein
MALPLIAAGVAARITAKKLATKAAKKSATKTVKATAQKSKTNQIAKNSVKVKDADNIKRLRSNVDSYYKTVKAKSGATAREKAAEVTRSNKITNPQVLRVKSSSTKPYKVTGGAGSTARRAAEKAKKNK